MMSILFIDDERFPPNDGKDWDIVRSGGSAIEYMLTNNEWNYISFDHDLGLGMTGYDVVNWMIEHDQDMGGSFIPQDFDFYVHSQNNVGAENIRFKLRAYLDQR
jgi:hypothetical protein